MRINTGSQKEISKIEICGMFSLLSLTKDKIYFWNNIYFYLNYKEKYLFLTQLVNVINMYLGFHLTFLHGEST